MIITFNLRASLRCATGDEIQSDGFVLDAVVLRSNGPRVNTWDRSAPSLQWDFDPERLEAAVIQLVGKPILVGGAPERIADEVVSFRVMLDSPTGRIFPAVQPPIRLHGPNDREVRLEVMNQLTRKTATCLLHFFHHLSNGTYFRNFIRSSNHDDFEVQFNPDICTALRKARGGKVLEVYTTLCGRSRWYRNIYEEALEAQGLKIHTRSRTSLFA